MAGNERDFPGYASTLEIGRIIGRVESLEKDVSELKQSYHNIDEKLDNFKDTINSIKNTLNNVVIWTQNKDKQEQQVKKNISVYELAIVSTIIGGIMGIVVGVILKFL